MEKIKWSFKNEYIDCVLHGSKLEIAVWKVVSEIPEGEVLTYSEVAERAGFPCAVRAVASAVGRNPLPIIIPCHRVIRKSGLMGNYAYGVEMKKDLLRREGVIFE